MGDERIINVVDLRPGMKAISCSFIVLDIGEPTTTKEGHTVRSVLVADRTGSISLSVWDEWGEAVKSGDILKLSKGYASLWKGSLTLYIGRTGILQKIGEFTMVFSETPNMSEQQFDSSGGLGPGPSDTSSQAGSESQLSFGGGRGPPASDPRHLMPSHHEVPRYMGPRAGVPRHPIERHGGPPLMSGEHLRPVHSRPMGRSHAHGSYGPRHQADQPRSNHWS